MRIITLWEPWATLMATGYKRCETRSWGTDYRGDVAIHASVNRKKCRITHEVEKMWSDAGLTMPEGWPMRAEEYPLGRIIAVGRLVDCVKMTVDIIGRQSRMERAFGDWRPGRVAWVFASMRRLPEQIPWKGAQGFRTLPAELEARISA